MTLDGSKVRRVYDVAHDVNQGRIPLVFILHARYPSMECTLDIYYVNIR